MRVLLSAVVFCCSFGLLWAKVPAIPQTLDAEAMHQALKEASVEMYPNADSITVGQLEYNRYEADGTGAQWFEFYAKALTPTGMKELRDMSTGYHEGFSESEILLAEVIQADGTVVPVDLKANTAVATSNRMASANIYDPSQKRVTLTIPKAEVGDSLHVVIGTRDYKVRIPNSFSSLSMLEDESPTPYAEVVVEGPNELAIKSAAVINPVGKTVTATEEKLPNNRFLRRWIARDVPQMYPEENMPETLTQCQRVAYSTFASWSEVSQWYWGLCVSHLTTTPEIRQKVAELIANATTEDEKMLAIFRFVSQDIRYMGVIKESTAPGYEPHDVALTFNNRYGVCRDKGVLLVAMLREAGFEAYPTLINAGAKYSEKVPLPYFNHAIVAVDRGGRDYTFLDPTDETTRDPFPSYLSDCSYLVARPDGERLRITPTPSPEDSLLALTTDGTLDANGTLTLSCSATFKGINDNVYRSLLVRNTKETLERTFSRILKGLLPGAGLTSLTFLPKEASDINQPLSMKLTARVPNYANTDDQGKTLIELPFLSRVMGYVNFAFDGLDQPERKYDWVISAPSAVREKLTLRGFDTLGTPIVLPKDPIFKANGASYDILVKKDGDVYVLNRNLELSHKTYSPEDYLALREFLRQMQQADMLKPLFVKDATLSADALVLSSTQTVTLDEDLCTFKVNATEDRQILTYNGKKRYAEFKTQYTPAYQDFALDRKQTYVTRTTGERQDLEDVEINVMDADGASLIARYPTAKRVVVAFPAVEVGAVTHLAFEKSNRRGYAYYDSFVFGEGNPIKEQSFTLNVPLAQVDQIKVVEKRLEGIDVTHTVTTNDAAIVSMTWTAKNLPAYRSEGNTPNPEFFQPAIFISTAAAAPQIAVPQWLESFNDAINGKSSQVAALARAVTTSEMTLDEKLRAIQEVVAQRLIQQGPAWYELASGTFSSPDETLKAGYGNTADVLIVRAAMMRELGIAFDPVMLCNYSLHTEYLISVLTALDTAPNTGLWARFMLLLPNGRIVGMEGRYDVPGAVGSKSPHHMISRTGSNVYVAPETLANDGSSRDIYTIEANGDAYISSNSEAYGLDAGGIKKIAAEIKPRDLERLAASTADAIAVGGVPDSELIFDASGYPARKHLRVFAKGFATRQGNTLSIPLRIVPELSVPSGQNRRTPIWFGDQTSGTNVVKVLLPKGAKVLIKPQPFNYRLGGGGVISLNVREELDVTGRQSLIFTSKADRRSALLDPYCIGALQDLQRRLSAPNMHILVVELPEEKAQ